MVSKQIVHSKNSNKLIMVLTVFFIVTVIIPLLVMLCNIKWNDIGSLVGSSAFTEALGNSLFVTTIATCLSVFLAFLLAYAISRSKMKYKKAFSILFTIPMLIPSISHGLGLINLFGDNGIFTSITGINIHVFGPTGIILGSILYSFPVAFLILQDAFQYIDNSLYEMCEVLGISKIRMFFKVTMHYMAKPLLSAIFATFTMIFTDYGVGLAIGGRYTILPVYLYKEVIGLLDFSKGAMIGLVLIIPAVISFIFDTLTKEESSLGFTVKKARIRKNLGRDIFFTVLSILVVLFIFFIIGSFIYLGMIKKYPYDTSLTLDHFQTVFQNGFGKSIINSLVMAFLTAGLGTAIAYFCAYVTARIGGKRAKGLHIISMLSLAIPGIVLGLSFILVFKNTFLYGTLFIMVVVNIIHFFASPYLMAYNALQKVNKNYEIIGSTYGIRRMHMLWNVILPCTKETIIEMFGYFFVNSMMTISAVAFLFTVNTMPMSLWINQFEGQLLYEEAAVVSIGILVINLIYKVVATVIKKRVEKK